VAGKQRKVGEQQGLDAEHDEIEQSRGNGTAAGHI